MHNGHAYNLHCMVGVNSVSNVQHMVNIDCIVQCMVVVNSVNYVKPMVVVIMLIM